MTEHAPDAPRLAILGAGPVGLDAALAAADAGLPFTVYEAAEGPAAHVAAWGHVRLFSPWDLDVSPRMRRHLEAAGHPVPSGDACPTGAELVARVFAPVAALPVVAPRVRYRQRVVAVGREGLLKHREIASAERARRPFRLLVAGPGGAERTASADVVLDCTGIYGQPNALGDGGIPAAGERELDAEIRRHLPDLAAEAEHWAGRTTLLVGGGHSAQTAARDLAALAVAHPGTRVLWLLPQEPPAVEPDDPLPERRRVAAAAREIATGGSPACEPLPGARVAALGRDGGGRIAVQVVHPDGRSERRTVDRVLALTGYVGDLGMIRQLQVHQCYATEGPMKLSAALLGAAAGDCLAQASHGVETLLNPEPGFFLLGAKSYGRNNSFLLRVGWQQVDEVAGWLAGRREEAA
ncbi:MAG TPA: flavoprotein [Thermoanaerobaculia bacterium]|nr:flavoprotein [Thermoanaerobaculia bacterium]